jgi:hypothetical protein
MKSVLRSAFDPVPRPLSTGAQLLVVGLLVVGITISVVEYLEHSRPELLAQQPLSAPASPALQNGLQTRASAPAESGLRTRSLVRVAPHPATPSGSASASPADQPFDSASREPSPAGTAPMSLRPGEDG